MNAQGADRDGTAERVRCVPRDCRREIELTRANQDGDAERCQYAGQCDAIDGNSTVGQLLDPLMEATVSLFATTRQAPERQHADGLKSC
jgi:hypothetical protein